MDIDSGFTYHYITVETELTDGAPIPEDFELQVERPSYKGRLRRCYAVIDPKQPPDPTKLAGTLAGKLFKQSSYVPSGKPVPEWAQNGCRSQILDDLLMIEQKSSQILEEKEEYNKLGRSNILFSVLFGAFFVDKEKLPSVPASLSAAIGGWEKVSSGLAEGNKQCVICLGGDEEMEKSNLVNVKMPCEHVYHRICIVKWLLRSHLCPLCRYALPLDSHYFLADYAC